jgi:hypothetical protein
MNSRRLIDLPSIAEAYPRSLDCPADIEGLTPEKQTRRNGIFTAISEMGQTRHLDRAPMTSGLPR